MDNHPEVLNNAMIRMIAKTDFDTALRRSSWRAIKSWFTKKDNELLPFDEVIRQLPTRGQHYLGIREIPIDSVIGSVGRYHDFDRAFLPRQSHTKSRWMSIDSAHLKDVILPPIEVFKIGDAYFVKDGNHRVSVARERGQVFIDADVIQLDVEVPIDSDLSIDDIVQKREQAIFYEKINKKKLLLDAEIEVTASGAYCKLLEHIDVHRWYMGVEQKGNVTWDDAVLSWYNDVFLPLVKVIHEQDILQHFPKRTETDLYIWIIEHFQYLREKYHKNISLEQAATHFTKEYSPGFFKNICRFLSGKKTIAEKAKLEEETVENCEE